MAKNKLHDVVFKDSYFWGVSKLTVGVWLLYLSSLYVSGSGNYLLKITFFPDMQVYLIFGAITAFIYHSYYRVMYNDGRRGRLPLPVITLAYVADVLAFTSLYSIVLFPLCGFGVIQWLLIIYILFSQLVVSKKNDIYRYFSPLSLLIFCSLMYIVKAFVQYVFPINIYQTLIIANDTARWIIFAIAVIAGIYQLINLFASKKSTEPIQIESKIPAISLVGKQIKRGIGFVLTAGFIIPLIGILLSGGLILFFVVFKIEADFWKLFGPLLDKLLTTDRRNILQSQSLSFFQLSALFIYFIYFFINYEIFNSYVRDKSKKIMKYLRYYPEEIGRDNHIKWNDDIMVVSNRAKVFADIERYYQESDEFSEYGEKKNRKHFIDHQDSGEFNEEARKTFITKQLGRE